MRILTISPVIKHTIQVANWIKEVRDLDAITHIEQVVAIEMGSKQLLSHGGIGDYRRLRNIVFGIDKKNKTRIIRDNFVMANDMARYLINHIYRRKQTTPLVGEFLVEMLRSYDKVIYSLPSTVVDTSRTTKSHSFYMELGGVMLSTITSIRKEFPIIDLPFTGVQRRKESLLYNL